MHVLIFVFSKRKACSESSELKIVELYLQVVVANMLREIWEDSHRHADDRVVNNRKVETLRNGTLDEVCLALSQFD